MCLFFFFFFFQSFHACLKAIEGHEANLMSGYDCLGANADDNFHEHEQTTPVGIANTRVWVFPS
jgi:hypothetical protein